MGSSTSVLCDNCGYNVVLMLGGGRLNHTTYAAWPVTCFRCWAATTANFKNLPLTCIDCQSTDVLPFNDAKLWKGDGEVTETWEDELDLTSGHYRCPKCGKYELRFDAIGDCD